MTDVRNSPLPVRDAQTVRTWRTRVQVRSFLILVISASAVAVLYWAAVTSHSGQAFDDAVLDGHKLHGSWFHWAVLRRVTRHSVLPLACGALLAFAIAVARRRYHQAIAAAILVGGSFVTTELLKLKLLTRPNLFGSLWPDNTFPSGHTTAAVSVAMGLVLVVPQNWRGKVAGVVGLCAMVVANGTMAQGWHRASDAMAAAFVACGWFAVVVGTLVWVGWAEPADKPRAQQLSRAYRPMALIAALGWLFGVVRLGSDLRLLRSGVVVTDSAFVHVYFTADLLVVASVATAMTLCLIATRGIAYDVAGPDRPSVHSRRK